MQIPRLVRSSRTREYNDYNDYQRANVVKEWLFDGKTHREIDREILKLDSNYSRGYQSMGILHYLGLNKEFHGIFKGMSIDEAINLLKETGRNEYDEIIGILNNLQGITDEQMKNDIDTENEDVYEVHSEGNVTQYYTTKYERNPQNRREAIKIHGTKCMACGFDFEKVYGERGKDYIEVHHVIPLASRNEEVKINPKTDLIVVCANCHRMIHRKKNQVLSLEELKQIIESNRRH